MRFALCCLLTLCFVFAKGQDTIHFTNKTTQVVKVIDITEKAVTYNKYDNLTGPLYTADRNDIYCIKYANGITDWFNTNIIQPAHKVNSRFDNYYASWHQNIKDTTLSRKLSPFAVYLSAGIGTGHIAQTINFADLLNLTLAYKSHIISLSTAYNGYLLHGESEPGSSPYVWSGYHGVTVGEAIRLKSLLFSATIGVASSYVQFYTYYWSGARLAQQYSININKVVSMPIEFKLFYTAPFNGIGVGVFVCENILTLHQFSALSPYDSFYFGFSIVTGYWNKHKK